MSDIEIAIIKILQANPGLSDREIAVALKGNDKSLQYVNQSCRAMKTKQILFRKKRQDGLIGNWLFEKYRQTLPSSSSLNDYIPEKKMKQALEKFLQAKEWKAEINWREWHGNDIEAIKGSDRWVIEVKGSGSYDAMNLTGFLSVLGEILQRMDDPACKYSIAIPDIAPFRRMWNRLPDLAKYRLGITALFVNENGNVFESIIDQKYPC
jgi:hypothetical protein